MALFSSLQPQLQRALASAGLSRDRQEPLDCPIKATDGTADSGTPTRPLPAGQNICLSAGDSVGRGGAGHAPFWPRRTQPKWGGIKACPRHQGFAASVAVQVVLAQDNSLGTMTGECERERREMTEGGESR